MEVWIGQEGRVSRDCRSIEHPYFYSAFPNLQNLPSELHIITKLGVVFFVAPGCGFDMIVVQSSWSAEYCSHQSKNPASYCMVTYLSRFFFLRFLFFLILVSCTIFSFFVFEVWCSAPWSNIGLAT